MSAFLSGRLDLGATGHRKEQFGFCMGLGRECGKQKAKDVSKYSVGVYVCVCVCLLSKQENSHAVGNKMVGSDIRIQSFLGKFRKTD